MDAERRSRAIGGDVIEKLIEFVGAPAHNMQQGTEHFFLELARTVKFDNGRSNIGAALREIIFEPEHHGAARFHAGKPTIELTFSLRVDNRADVSRWIARIAEFELTRGTPDHIDYPV